MEEQIEIKSSLDELQRLQSDNQRKLRRMQEQLANLSVQSNGGESRTKKILKEEIRELQNIIKENEQVEFDLMQRIKESERSQLRYLKSDKVSG